jgi:hypothetical protein
VSGLVRGRGGRVIVIDESHAKPLSDALAGVPHVRDLTATQPIEPPVLPSLRWWERVEEATDRLYERVDRRGIYVFLGVILVALVGLFVWGATR